MNRFWIILSIVVVGLVGVFFITKPKDEKPKDTGEITKVASDDHAKWSADSEIVLIEYGDFQCPGCASYYPTIKELGEEYGDKVKFVFRHLPLRNIHPNAQSAALAAEAASKQGKFWEMHDRLFETQSSWGQVASNQQKLFEEYAKELGLDEAKFRADYTDSTTSERINRDVNSATQLGITGTPAFILNGKRIDTPANNIDAFRKILDEALDSVKAE